ncbi:MAG TPA: protein translocase subunit SecD, partial [Sporomusaceae bacterium]|nr:protein translocase subunit SecD [Sporomusaceae bacterium]
TAVLFLLGSGPIKGFAVTLGLGVVISMFTAITVSGSLLRMLIHANVVKNSKFFGA